ncbi:hypothetical protein C7E17_27300, partial [Stenotrophomonas maltophilia]
GAASSPARAELLVEVRSMNIEALECMLADGKDGSIGAASSPARAELLVEVRSMNIEALECMLADGKDG